MTSYASDAVRALRRRTLDIGAWVALRLGISALAYRPEGPTGCGRQDLYLFKKRGRAA